MPRKKINPRAAILDIKLTIGSDESRHVIELPDFKGSVTGSQFRSDYVVKFLRRSLSDQFGGPVK